jgi:hypothetical protein
MCCWVVCVVGSLSRTPRKRTFFDAADRIMLIKKPESNVRLGTIAILAVTVIAACIMLGPSRRRENDSAEAATDGSSSNASVPSNSPNRSSPQDRSGRPPVRARPSPFPTRAPRPDAETTELCSQLRLEYTPPCPDLNLPGPEKRKQISKAFSAPRRCPARAAFPSDAINFRLPKVLKVLPGDANRSEAQRSCAGHCLRYHDFLDPCLGARELRWTRETEAQPAPTAYWMPALASSSFAGTCHVNCANNNLCWMWRHSELTRPNETEIVAADPPRFGGPHATWDDFPSRDSGTTEPDFWSSVFKYNATFTGTTASPGERTVQEIVEEPVKVLMIGSSHARVLWETYYNCVLSALYGTVVTLNDSPHLNVPQQDFVAKLHGETISAFAFADSPASDDLIAIAQENRFPRFKPDVIVIARGAWDMTLAARDAELVHHAHATTLADARRLFPAAIILSYPAHYFALDYNGAFRGPCLPMDRQVEIREALHCAVVRANNELRNERAAHIPESQYFIDEFDVFDLAATMTVRADAFRAFQTRHGLPLDAVNERIDIADGDHFPQPTLMNFLIALRAHVRSSPLHPGKQQLRQQLRDPLAPPSPTAPPVPILRPLPSNFSRAVPDGMCARLCMLRNGEVPSDKMNSWLWQRCEFLRRRAAEECAGGNATTPVNATQRGQAWARARVYWSLREARQITLEQASASAAAAYRCMHPQP